MATYPAWRAFHVPKQGRTAGEYEDAFAGNGYRGRYAIADGASESAFAAAWARLLVKGYVATSGPWSAWLPAARQSWRSEAGQVDLPWYAEAKFEEGAYAAFLGLAFTDDSWHAEAVGDSCLFVVRGQRLVRAFPIRDAGAFGNEPSLLGSRRRQNGQPRARRSRMHGQRRPDDAYFLMTDALAQWFLQQAGTGRRPWEALAGIETDEQFAGWIDARRAAGQLRNDDVTVICLQSV